MRGSKKIILRKESELISDGETVEMVNWAAKEVRFEKIFQENVIDGFQNKTEVGFHRRDHREESCKNTIEDLRTLKHDLKKFEEWEEEK